MSISEEQVNVDDELPELSFHVAGAEATGQTLTLRPAAYVLQANMDVASPHIQNILGFLPMEVFQTRKEQVCMPAFAVDDYRTKQNGDVWIMGTPLFYEYTVHYDRTAGAPSMAFSYAGDVACGTCKGERIVRDGPSLLSEGASKPDGLTSLRKLKHLPTTRRLDTFSGSF
ncbi:unnamed protein product [Symbiodinium microadriaticum]|nr:unnamed protein product [Symbiodinium sp. KB8]CAE7877561.1 unnamed protein product [Symbiodinium microadriaticum]